MVDAHKDVMRKGRGVPYLVHPLEAVSIVSMITKDQELMAAAALHDVVEDTNITIEDIRHEFGDRVASLVNEETVKAEAGVDKTATWRARKQQVVNQIAAGNYDSKVVAIGDKLSNMRTMYYDYQIIGDKLWDRFNTHNPEDHKWYYLQLCDALSDLKDTSAYMEFCELVHKLFNI